MYLTRTQAQSAVKKMLAFSDEIFGTYESYGITLYKDVGRRNIILSAAQEKFFAEEIEGASNDGRTGEADIIINTIGGLHELECKLTSQGTRGEWRLQADERTLHRKSSLDILYMLTDRELSKVGVFLFEGLSPHDFHTACSSSRGKARMKKYQAFKKCIPLIGNFRFKKRGNLSPGVSIELEELKDVI